MIIKNEVNDIVLFNVQGTMGVGIIVRVLIIGESAPLYTMDNGVDVREDQITRYLGNAKRIAQDIEDEIYEKSKS